jgi:O-antigen ligase
MKLPHPARILQVIAVLVPVLAVVAPRGLAAALPVAALAAAAAAWSKDMLRPPPALPSAIIVAFLCWAAASALWAIEPRLVWSIWPQIVALAACGLLLLGVARGLEDESRNAVGLALALGIVIALVLLALEWASSMMFERSLGATLHAQLSQRPFYTYVFNRSAATLALLVWPAAFAVQRRFGWTRATLLIVATLLVVSGFDSMAAIVGMGAGLVVWLILSSPRRGVGMAFTAALAIGAASIPFMLPDNLFGPPAHVERTSPLPPMEDTVSVTHRLAIWRFVGQAIAERPLAGWGLNASRELPGGTVEVAPGANRLPLHPHNAFLQVWLELGTVGFALSIALGITALWAAATPRLSDDNDSRYARAAAIALLAGGSLVASVAYGIWQGWWMAALWLAAGFMSVLTVRATPPDARRLERPVKP